MQKEREGTVLPLAVSAFKNLVSCVPGMRRMWFCALLPNIKH